MELRQISKLMLGASPDRAAVDSVDYIRAGDIAAGSMGSPRPGPAPARGQDSRLVKGDVVVRGRGAALAAVVDGGAAGAYPTNDVFRLRPDPSLAQAEYLATFLNLPQTQDELIAGTQGAVLSRLSVEALGKIDVPLPSIKIQRVIVDLSACVRRERKILEKLSKLRWQLNQELLHRAMKKTHDEGSHPRRGPQTVNRSADGRPNSHLQ